MESSLGVFAPARRHWSCSFGVRQWTRVRGGHSGSLAPAAHTSSLETHLWASQLNLLVLSATSINSVLVTVPDWNQVTTTELSGAEWCQWLTWDTVTYQLSDDLPAVCASDQPDFNQWKWVAGATRRFHIIGSVEVGRCFLVGNLIKRRDICVGFSQFDWPFKVPLVLNAGWDGWCHNCQLADCWKTCKNPPRPNSQRRIAMQEKGRDVFVCFEELPKRPGLSWVSIQTSNLWLELLALGPFHSCLVFKS